MQEDVSPSTSNFSRIRRIIMAEKYLETCALIYSHYYFNKDQHDTFLIASLVRSINRSKAMQIKTEGQLSQ